MAEFNLNIFHSASYSSACYCIIISACISLLSDYNLYTSCLVGGPKKVTPPPFLDQSQQHMNPSFVNSPSFPEKLMAGTAQSPTVSDEVLSSIERTSRASSDKTQPTNHNSQALVGQHHVSAAATREDADSIHTQSTTKSTQEEMFIPPPPRLSFHLSVQPSSGSASSSVTKTDAALAAADAAILDDV